MLPLGSVPWMAPEDNISEAMERVETGRLDRLAVRRNGELLGFVSREDILRFTRRVFRARS